MAKRLLPDDLREFLKLLNVKRVEYLLIGGYAVGYYGYPRATGDMDIWVAISKTNARKVVDVLQEFGFGVAELRADLFLREDQIVRLGEAPLRIELLTSISGVRFADCHARRNQVRIDGLRVSLISLQDLKRNKAATGRAKDQADLEQLELLHGDQ
jgi:predicted nucleotidyltransferase